MAIGSSILAWRIPWTEGPGGLQSRGSRLSTHAAAAVYSLSRVCLSVTPWTVAHQAPLSMGFSKQVYRSELPFPSPEILPTQKRNLCPALVGGFFTTATGKPSIDACVAPTVVEMGMQRLIERDKVPFSHGLCISVGDT